MLDNWSIAPGPRLVFSNTGTALKALLLWGNESQIGSSVNRIQAFGIRSPKFVGPKFGPR